MTPEARLEQTRQLCRAANELAIAGIRLREGDLPKDELVRRLARLRYDTALIARIDAYRSGRLR